MRVKSWVTGTTPTWACSGSYRYQLGLQNPRQNSPSRSSFLTVAAMDGEDANPETPKSTALPKHGSGSQSSSSHIHPPHPPPLNSVDETRSNKPLSPREFVLSVASKIASQPLQNFDSNVWGVLTAISGNARKRQQVFVRPPSSVVLITNRLPVVMVLRFWCFVVPSYIFILSTW